MHRHNCNPVYFTLIPSHDCEVIKLQNILLIFLFPVYCKRSLFRHSSQIQTSNIFSANTCISTKTLFYITSICLNVCCCILHPNACCCVSTLLLLLRGSVYILCKCTNWSFEADMAVSTLILCHYKFIYTPIIKVPSLLHG